MKTAEEKKEKHLLFLKYFVIRKIKTGGMLTRRLLRLPSTGRQQRNRPGLSFLPITNGTCGML
jgi:hypothetical protein